MQALSLSRLRRGTIALGTLTVCGAASAAQLQYDFTVPTTSTSFNASPSVPRFDPSFGTLLSVTFGLKDSMTSQISLSNQSDNSDQAITGTVVGTFTLKSAGGGTTYVVGNTLTVANGTGIDGFGRFAINNDPIGNQQYNSPWGRAFAAKTAADSLYVVSNAFTDTATKMAFTGTTNISFLYNATADASTVHDAGNIATKYVTTSSASGYVIYNYAPVPEPTSLAALAIGGLALVRRRKAVVR